MYAYHYILKPDRSLQGRACRMQRHGPGLITDHTVRGYPAPALERLDGGLGVRAEAAVNRAGGRVPLPGRTVGEHPLQAADNVASGPNLQGWHGATVWKGGPGRRTNNTVDHQTCAILEVPDRSLGIRSEYAINSQAGIRSAPQGPLHPADYIAGRTRSDRWLSRIGQGSISLR